MRSSSSNEWTRLGQCTWHCLARTSPHVASGRPRILPPQQWRGRSWWSSVATPPAADSSSNVYTIHQQQNHQQDAANIDSFSRNSLLKEQFKKNSNSRRRNSPELLRHRVLQAALIQVHQQGWTEDAIASAVVAEGLPVTWMGLVTTSDLIAFCMQQANDQFRTILQTELIPKWQVESQCVAGGSGSGSDAIIQPPLQDRLAQAIQARLTCILPYCQSRTWHDGMALGAMPSNVLHTQAQLQEMLTTIMDGVTSGTKYHGTWGVVERMAIGAIYVATELHLLTDTSLDQVDTWSFLQQRVNQLQWLAAATTSTSTTTAVADAAMVVSAVAESLFGAAVSLTLSSSPLSSSSSSTERIRSVQEAVERTTAQVQSIVQPIIWNASNVMVNNPAHRQHGTRPGDYDVVANNNNHGSSNTNVIHNNDPSKHPDIVSRSEQGANSTDR